MRKIEYKGTSCHDDEEELCCYEFDVQFIPFNLSCYGVENHDEVGTSKHGLT